MKLPRISLAELKAAASKSRRDPVDAATMEAARAIMENVRLGGEEVLAEYAAKLDGNAGRLWYGGQDCLAALESLPESERNVLESAAERIRAFARAQKDALGTIELAIPGGMSGQELLPIQNVGCYVPGGAHSLPSSALMTIIPARVAGCASVAVACPRPSQAVLAACALGGADLVLAAGGAQAIAAFVYGLGPMARRDLIVGPGNRYVTAAKRLAREAGAGTDAEAGPSELLILADSSADPVALAWDLLAQAEHDPDAFTALACDSEDLARAVEARLESSLERLATDNRANASTAKAALQNSWILVSPSRSDLAEAANILAPEHLELAVREPEKLARLCVNAGAIFLGTGCAEALGDYGAGPNHTLPTAGAARYAGGLSVYSFTRVRTWIRMDQNPASGRLYRDSASLARMEGLYAHARSAESRLGS